MSEKEKLQLENECLMKYSKAQMIQKYIDELEENSKLSELWCDNRAKIRKLENQQKELIEYLEDLIKQNETVVEVSKYGLPKNCSKLLIDFYKQILQKYKDIIGDVKNEN